MQKHIAIVFIGTSVYLKYFKRFYTSVTEYFAAEASRHFFLFTENYLGDHYENVTLTKVRFANKRDIKLHKFHFINQIKSDLQPFDYVFYFDADSLLAAPISLASIDSWLDEKALVGVMHPWLHIRDTDKRFEKNPVSSAYVSLEKYSTLPYHQSCFWGGRTEDVLAMSAAIQQMVDRDLAIGHVNEHKICDEIYVNKYFLENSVRVHSLDTSYAHPGGEYERATRKHDRPGYRFHGAGVIVHDNANQTVSWKALTGDGACFSHGAYAQFFKADLAACVSLRDYRQFNPQNPVYLVSDGGADLAFLADRFHCHYVHENINIGTWKARHQKTDQYLWLERIRDGCLTTLSSVDWVILLEPDVECFRSPTRIPQYALSGPSPGPAWTPELKEIFFRKFGPLTRSMGLGHNFTGCGGSIFNRRVFLECLTQTPRSAFEDAAKLDGRILLAEDVTLSFLFQINGYDTGRWEDFTGWRDENKQDYAVAHGNKRHYGKPINFNPGIFSPVLFP
jgi:hypothetical protein